MPHRLDLISRRVTKEISRPGHRRTYVSGTNEAKEIGQGYRVINRLQYAILGDLSGAPSTDAEAATGAAGT